MTLNNEPKVAKPEQGSIKRVALCSTCGDQIQWAHFNRLWFHESTGFVNCSEAYQDKAFLTRIGYKS
jgi:hypothetical protein